MNIHFIGIGGISMSGLAAICLDLGDRVSGSDKIKNPEIDMLTQKGAIVSMNHHRDNLPHDTDMVIYTAAIRSDNPELLKAQELGIKTMDRAHFLGYLMAQHKFGIAVSGTHGKTSTTSMLSTIFLNSEFNPTISIGGNLKEIGGNYKIGSDDFFITEACEYVDSFLSLNPMHAIILNIEHEHIDYFKTLEQEIKSFRTFASSVPLEGKVIANGDDKNVLQALEGLPNVVYFGFEPHNNCVISDYEVLPFGSRFSLTLDGTHLGFFEINVIGRFNVLNASASILSAYFAGVEKDLIKKGIAAYHGVGRRFEKKGVYKGAQVFDDYAHHPSEVRATLSAAKDLEKNRLITVFQPHTFSRTFSLMAEFEESFDDTDMLILTDIYPSREIDSGYVHSTDLYERLKKRLSNVCYMGSNEDIVNYLASTVENGDIIVAMGAGDINKLSQSLINQK